jgi:uncharacterized beta-barrel protein YwiB (DUF1934 family)
MEKAQLLQYCTKIKNQGIYVRSYGMYENTANVHSVKIAIVHGHVVVTLIYGIFTWHQQNLSYNWSPTNDCKFPSK